MGSFVFSTWLRFFLVDSRQVIDTGSCAQIFAQSVGRVFVQSLAYIRFRVIHVPEDACAGRTYIYTGGGRLRIYARFKSLGETAVNGLIAEGALFRHAARTPLHLRRSPFRDGWIFTRKCFPIEGTCLIWAGDLAIPAANTAVIIHHHDTVITIVGGFYWADFNTWGFFTMHAWAGKKYTFISNHAIFHNLVPLDLGAGIIVCLAGQCAITASHTLRLVDDHCPLMFAFWRITRGFGGRDRACSSSDRNSNRRQLQKFP